MYDLDDIKPGMSSANQMKAARAIREALAQAASGRSEQLDADALLAKDTLTEDEQRQLARDILRWSREGSD